MRVERRDGSAERQVLLGMIISKTVLGPIAARWDRGLLPSPWAQEVAKWCVDHYKKYDRAPNGSIGRYFLEWAESGRDKDTVKLVEEFLNGLSEEAERLTQQLSPDHLLDVAADLFNRTRAAAVKTRIEECLEIGDVKKAWACIDSARPVEVGSGAGVSVLSDEEALVNALDSAAGSTSSIDLPGALGNFFGPSLGPDQFIAFMGKEKVGKSFHLQNLAWWAATRGRNVAYFEAGDMSQNQVLRRFAARAAGRPLKAGRYRYPVGIEPGTGNKLPEVAYETREYDRDLTTDEALDSLARWRKKVGPDRLKLSCHPNTSLSVAAAEGVVESWERDGWSPNCVFFDYLDIAAPPDPRAEPRENVNSTWKAARAFSQRRHACFVSATQTNKDGYTAKTLGRENFSEDHRKLAHATGVVGINQTTAEKEAGLYRLNWVVLRELEFAESKCVWCGAALAFGDPAVVSTF